MTKDISPQLGALLDGMVATGGGRTKTFRFLPWGRHFDARRLAALTASELPLSVRKVTNVKRDSDIGSGVQQNVQLLDVHAYWQDGTDITDPDAWFKAVEAAIMAVVRANEKTLTDAWFASPQNAMDFSNLQGKGTAVMFHELVLTVRALGVEIYGA